MTTDETGAKFEALMENKPPVGPDTEKEKKIAPGILAARRILDDYTIITDERTNETYVYNGGCYYCGILSSNILNKEIRNQLDGNYTITKKRNAMGYINDFSLGPMKFSGGYISVENGYVHLNTRKRIEHHAGVVLRNKFPVTYDPKAEYDDFSAYVLEIVGGIQEYADTIQEYVGYSFVNGQPAKKLLYTYGESDSGKTTLFEILLAFFGQENCSDLSLIQLCDKFLSHNIRNKIANIRADIDYKLVAKSVNLIKSLSGGDTIDVDKKYSVDVIQMKNNAKIFLSGNGVPQLPEEGVDDAFYRRWLPVLFPNRYKPDDDFLDKFLTKESMSGMLNWALDGYDRLKENRWIFSYNPTVESIKEWFAGGILPTAVENFLLECCIQGEDFFIPKTETYELFRLWCEHTGTNPIPVNDFGRKISKNRYCRVRRYRPMIGDEQVECWQGFKKGPMGNKIVEIKGGIK